MSLLLLMCSCCACDQWLSRVAIQPRGDSGEGEQAEGRAAVVERAVQCLARAMEVLPLTGDKTPAQGAALDRCVAFWEHLHQVRTQCSVSLVGTSAANWVCDGLLSSVAARTVVHSWLASASGADLRGECTPHHHHHHHEQQQQIFCEG